MAKWVAKNIGDKNSKDQKKILIINDEPDVCVVVERGVWMRMDFKRVSIPNLFLALENFKASTYDLLLLDIKMPGMDGFRLYQEMKKIDSEVEVCFQTANEMYYKKFRKQGQFAELDKDPFLRKPINKYRNN
jgi:DNA-binding NtrC family response regulator